METVVQRLERLYKTDNWSQNDKEWLAEYLKGDISELYLVALDGFSKDVLESKLGLDERDSAQILSNIHQRVLPPKQGFPVRRLLVRMAVAASVAAVLCTTYLAGKKFSNRVAPVKYEEIVTSKGALKLVQLADGTNIWLNADSRLRYPDQFNGNTREVTLTGEAFFDVVHDVTKPFIIHSGKISTNVLGTSFNIKAYTDDKTIKVTVVTGKVGVLTKGTAVKHSATLLTPGMQLVFTKTSGTLISEKVDAESVTGWRQGKLQYRNTPLFEVLADVQRKYNVVIKADKNLLNCALYADFNNLALPKVLKIMGVLINAHILKEGSGYRLRGKGCN